LIVRFEGLRVGKRGDRNGDDGAEIGNVVLFAPIETLRLRFFAFRGRLGGEGDRFAASPG